MRWPQVCTSLCAAAALAATAHSALAIGKAECIAANDQGNNLRQGGKLMASKAEYLKCADAACPAAIREECAQRVSAVEASLPTIVVAILDAQGKDVTDATVWVDDAKVADTVDGRAQPVDPGAHRLRIETSDGKSKELAFVARQGEKNRTLAVKLEAEAGTPPEAAPLTKPKPAETEADSGQSSAGPLPWVFAGFGVVALGSFTYFALSGKSDQNDLESRCAPNCKQSEADSLNQKYLIADISLGVAVLSLGAATYFFLSSGSTEPAKGGDIGFGMQPTRGGVALGARGSF
ncbi:MAG: hypothetical protein R3B13_13410 [Polyangiaceae bacterium]